MTNALTDDIGHGDTAERGFAAKLHSLADYLGSGSEPNTRQASPIPRQVVSRY